MKNDLLALLDVILLSTPVVATAAQFADFTYTSSGSDISNGAFYFSDPNWKNYPARNYRIRSP